MPTYILDTDAFSLVMDGVEPITSRVLGASASDLFTTAITVDESLSGWHALVRRSIRPVQLEFAYGKLIRAVQLFGKLQLLNFTQASSARFDSLSYSRN